MLTVQLTGASKKLCKLEEDIRLASWLPRHTLALSCVSIDWRIGNSRAWGTTSGAGGGCELSPSISSQASSSSPCSEFYVTGGKQFGVWVGEIMV